MQYLVDVYDKEHKFSFEPSTPETYLANQWLFFQVSGQGPYMGQAAWFMNYHPEHLPSVIDRYQRETERIVGVIDGYLQKSGLEFLVADSCNPKGKFTYADISFIPWGTSIPWIMRGRDDTFANSKYSAYKAWLDRMLAIPAVKEALELRQKRIAAIPGGAIDKNLQRSVKGDKD